MLVLGGVVHDLVEVELELEDDKRAVLIGSVTTTPTRRMEQSVHIILSATQTVVLLPGIPLPTPLPTLLLLSIHMVLLLILPFVAMKYIDEITGRRCQIFFLVHGHHRHLLAFPLDRLAMVVYEGAILWVDTMCLITMLPLL